MHSIQIEVIEGRYRGSSIDLSLGETYVLGRDYGCDIAIDDARFDERQLVFKPTLLGMQVEPLATTELAVDGVSLALDESIGLREQFSINGFQFVLKADDSVFAAHTQALRENREAAKAQAQRAREAELAEVTVDADGETLFDTSAVENLGLDSSHDDAAASLSANSEETGFEEKNVPAQGSQDKAEQDVVRHENVDELAEQSNTHERTVQVADANTLARSYLKRSSAVTSKRRAGVRTIVNVRTIANKVRMGASVVADAGLQKAKALIQTRLWFHPRLQMGLMLCLGLTLVLLVYGLVSTVFQEKPHPLAQTSSKVVKHEVVKHEVVKHEVVKHEPEQRRGEETDKQNPMPQTQSEPKASQPKQQSSPVEAAPTEQAGQSRLQGHSASSSIDFMASHQPNQIAQIMLGQVDSSESAWQLVRSTLDSFGFNELQAQWVDGQTSTSQVLALKGYTERVEVWERVKLEIRKHLALNYKILDQVATPALRAEVMIGWVREAGLSEKVQLSLQSQGLIAKVNLSKRDNQIWQRLADRYVKTFDNQPPLYRLSDPGDWLNIRSISFSEQPYFVTQDQKVHVVGANIGDGFVVEAITPEGIVLRDRFGLHTYRFE